MRVFVILIGIALAATGGVVAYRAAFVEPHGVVVISETAGRVRELPDMLRLVGGLVLLFVGVGCAAWAARRPPRPR
jgi:chloramphenicol 3-O-phosphotransferase